MAGKLSAEVVPLLDAKSKFLLRQFAQFKNPMQARVAYEDKFGELPTEAQLMRSNIGALQHNGINPSVQRSPRMKYFKDQRRKWLTHIKANAPLAVPEMRIWHLGVLFDIELARAKVTGNTGRCVNILEAAAKETAGYFSKTPQVNIDARSISMTSDVDLENRIKDLLTAFGSHLTAAKTIDNVKELPPVEYEPQEVFESDDEEDLEAVAP